MGSYSFHPDGNHSSFHPSRNSIRMYHIRNSAAAAIPPGCLTSGILLCRHSTWMSHIQMELLLRHSTRMSHIRDTPSPDISHPAPAAGWERRVFQLPLSDVSRSSNSAYPESFAAIFAQCRSVLLKLPNICDRDFGIF